MKKNKIHNIVSVKLGLAMLMLFGILSMAKAQETLTVSPIEIVPGEEAEVTVAYESDTDRKSFQMNITLPQGLTYVASEENGKIVKLGVAASDLIITEYGAYHRVQHDIHSLRIGQESYLVPCEGCR